MRVDRAEHRLERQFYPTDGTPAYPDQSEPARALVADATSIARHSLTRTDPALRRGDLDRAALLIQTALEARPHWGEAWTAASFVDSLRFGRDAPRVRASLARSYADAPFLHAAGPWRVRLGLERWATLDPATRGHVIREAVWLMRLDRTLREPIFALARGSGGYTPLLLRWRTLRAGDADFIGGQRPRP